MTDSMLAGRLDVRTKEFAVVEVPRPVPGPGQVLVEVRAAGICLSESTWSTGRSPRCSSGATR